MRKYASALLGLLLLVFTPLPVHAANGPLSGTVIALDPGHQLGNSNPKFSSQMKQTRFNGTIVKSCNTTGTATNKGLPEATFTWQVSQQLKKLLEAQGARVELTRTTNSRNSWGPCVWDRGGFSKKVGAKVFVSIHGDGAPAKGHGFHVIAPGRIKGWTEDTAAGSRTLARNMIAGMEQAGASPTTYLASPLSVRTDQSTLNFNSVPAV
ncbi:MAG: N-acetylmuramoyl-L-alanine amidase, partial [Actinomycetes bacterium]